LDRTGQIEKEIIAFTQLFSNLISQINDYGLENGINREIVNSRRDQVRRFKTKVETESRAKFELDQSFDATAYIHQQAKEVGLSQKRAEGLIARMGWLKTKKDGGIKATKGNIEKLNAIRKYHPESITITGSELDAVSKAEGMATIYFIRNFGTGKRGDYYIPDLVDGMFVIPSVNTDSEKNEE
jgi:hypothetical protein